ncbi:hypothetical protein E3T24_00855 [Cryobacterium sp. TmT2-59]|nr:hypothetical protein E3T24_00855 [Cryobacterium sp. TmT2-59]
MRVRAIGVVALATALVLTLTSCGVAAETAPAWKTALSQALKKLGPYGDEFGTMAKPAPVDDLAGALKGVPAQGLTAEEAAMIARAEAIVRFWREVMRVSASADTLAGAIPDEAIKLVTLRLGPNSSPEFVSHVDDLAARALKGLTCNMTQKLLDRAGKDAVANRPLSYDPAVGLTSDSVRTYFDANLAALGYDLTAVNETFAAYGFSIDAIGTATTWTSAITGVIDAPDLTTQRAYVYYIRLCLVPAR